MKLSTTNREGSLGELVKRLLPKATKAQRTAAEKKLLAANPHLAELKQLPAGTPVVVPDEVQQADVRDVVQDRLHAALVTAFDAMRQTRTELAAEIRAEDEAAKRSEEWLKSDEVQSAIKEDADVARSIAQAAKDASASRTERNAHRQELLDSVDDSLTLLKSLGGPADEPTAKRR